MSEIRAESPKPVEAEVVSEVIKTPTKSTPSKRKSKLEREREESEEIIRSLGGNAVEEGGRRTRSSARGAATPSPAAKKAKVESATPSRRGRQKKGIVDVEEPQDDATDAPATEATKTVPASEESTGEPSESMEVDGAICSKSTDKSEATESEDTKPTENGDVSESETTKAADEPKISDAVQVTQEVVEISSSSTSADDIAIEPVTDAAIDKSVSVEEDIVVPESLAISAPVVVADVTTDAADDLVAPAIPSDLVASSIPSDADVGIVESAPKVEEKLSEKDAEPTIAENDEAVNRQ